MIKDHDLEKHMRGPFARLVGMTLPLTYQGHIVGRARITDAEGHASIEGAVTDEMNRGVGGISMPALITPTNPGVPILHGPHNDTEGNEP